MLRPLDVPNDPFQSSIVRGARVVHIGDIFAERHRICLGV